MTDIPTVTPDALAQRLDAGESVLILDTRSAGAHASFPFDATRPVRMQNLPADLFMHDVAAGVAALPPREQAGPIVAFCSRGNSSKAVVRALLEAGYRAQSLEGGIMRWSERVLATPVPGSETLGGDAALLQFRRLGKGCLGYAVVAGGRALLVDVGRNVEAALSAVEARGAKVVRVLDTHLHADHISGGPAVARETGAAYGLPPADGKDVAFRFEPVTNDASWRIDGVEVRAIHTPGHTDGSTSYLVGGRYLLTGDTLFVAGVGRPDLSGQGERLARVLHATLTGTIAGLPDQLQVLPAHIAGAQEIGSAGVASARLGDLKRSTLRDLPKEADDFARAILAALPEQPPNYEKIRAANRGVLEDDPSELEFGPNRCAVRSGV